MIKLLSKNVQLSFFPNMSMKTLVVNNFVFIIGFKTILTASCQGWCWNTTSPKEGDKDLCRTHKDAKILVLLPSMFFEIIPNLIIPNLTALYMFILTSVCIFSILFSIIPWGADKENLFDNQELLLLVIISLEQGWYCKEKLVANHS